MRQGYVAIPIMYNLDTLFVGVCIQQGEQGSALLSDQRLSCQFYDFLRTELDQGVVCGPRYCIIEALPKTNSHLHFYIFQCIVHFLVILQ